MPNGDLNWIAGFIWNIADDVLRNVYVRGKSLDQFDFTAVPSLNKARVLDLAQGDYLDQRENLILMGQSGTGKTHLATSRGLIACQQGKNMRCLTAAGLITLLTEAQAGLRLSHLERNLAQLDLLIIAASGSVPFSEKGAQLFFQVVAQSYERQSLIMTPNLDFSPWPRGFGSEELTGALLDRLTHQAHLLALQGESFRFKKSMGTRDNLRWLPLWCPTAGCSWRLPWPEYPFWVIGRASPEPPADVGCRRLWARLPRPAAGLSCGDMTSFLEPGGSLLN